jgi:hypothetical protein
MIAGDRRLVKKSRRREKSVRANISGGLAAVSRRSKGLFGLSR